MEAAIISALPQLGTAGAAILVMYLMYRDASQRFSEKDAILIAQVDKHEQTLKEHQDYMREVHASTMVQLSHASKVIEESVRSHERIINYLNNKS